MDTNKIQLSTAVKNLCSTQNNKLARLSCLHVTLVKKQESTGLHTGVHMGDGRAMRVKEITIAAP